MTDILDLIKKESVQSARAHSEMLQKNHKIELEDLKKLPGNQRRDKQYEALSLAFKAEEDFHNSKLKECDENALKAIQMDPLCLDAYRVNILRFYKLTDADTAMLALRELIGFSKIFLLEKIRNFDGGKCAKSIHLRPYLRILNFLGEVAKDGNRPDIAIYAYEELLRLDHTDQYEKSHALLSCYIKVISREERGQPVEVSRSIEQLRKFLHFKSPITKKPLFDLTPVETEEFGESDIYTLARWCKFYIDFMEGKKWKHSAKKELKTSDWLLGSISMSIKAHPKYDAIDDKCLCLRCMMASLTKYALIDCPKFVISLHKYFYEVTDIKFNALCRLRAPDIKKQYSQEKREEYQNEATKQLDIGREQLKNNKFEDSLQSFSKCKTYVIENLWATDRWYNKAPFPMITNRTTAAYRLGMWNLARIDCRFSLLMKPNHIKTYQKLPDIVSRFNAKELQEEMNKIYEKSQTMKETDNWQQLAKRAIALLSLPAIYYSRTGKLTEKRIKDLEDKGINDMYTFINIPSYEYQLLPWLQEENFEKKVLF